MMARLLYYLGASTIPIVEIVQNVLPNFPPGKNQRGADENA